MLSSSTCYYVNKLKSLNKDLTCLTFEVDEKSYKNYNENGTY